LRFLTPLLATIHFIIHHPLNARHRIKAVLNFARWQIGARILGRKVIVPWVGDAQLVIGLGDNSLTGNLYAGLMEYEDMAFLLHTLQPDETFVDVGANAGAYTILASKVAGAKTVAFEPLPETAQKLREQVAINGIEALVDIRTMGVGDSRQTLFFTNDKDAVNKVSVGGEAINTTPVEVTTLDDTLSGEPCFIKIDVEGFEFAVLKGAAKTLSAGNVSAVILELNGSGEEFVHGNQAIHEAMLGFGYTPVAYEPRTRTLLELAGHNSDSLNTIYVRDFGLMAERCKSAPKRLIHTAHGVEV
jgi:FkbM family methyltransferase